MRILVTGAHGFIGSHLCERLLAGGHRVRAMVTPWGKLENLDSVAAHPLLEMVRADVTDPQTLRGSCEGVEAIVHAAAKVGDWGPSRPLMEVNAGGTANLLEEARRARTSRFVLVSSVAVHRYRGFRDADAEKTPRDNTSLPYARSKIAAEDAVFSWSGEGAVVRPGLWPFGPRDPQLRRVANALLAGRLPLVGRGDRLLNTAYVENLVQGLELAATAPLLPRRAYVVADEGAPSWAEVLGELARLLGSSPPRLHLPPSAARLAGALGEAIWSVLAPAREPPLTRYRASLMQRDVHFAIEPAKQELGYRPEFSWQQGLASSVASDVVLRNMAAR